MLSIQLANDKKNYLPGEQISGVVTWELSSVPKDAMVKLFWYTQGIGTQDIGVADEFEYAAVASGREAFLFTIPASPYSFSGVHITLQWAVELLVNKGKEHERLDIFVSPFDEPILLEKGEKSGFEKKAEDKLRALSGSK